VRETADAAVAGIALPSTNASEVRDWKNSTIRGHRSGQPAGAGACDERVAILDRGFLRAGGHQDRGAAPASM
jgi:hypothetical protein